MQPRIYPEPESQYHTRRLHLGLVPIASLLAVRQYMGPHDRQPRFQLDPRNRPRTTNTKTKFQRSFGKRSLQHKFLPLQSRRPQDKTLLPPADHMARPPDSLCNINNKTDNRHKKNLTQADNISPTSPKNIVDVSDKTPTILCEINPCHNSLAERLKGKLKKWLNIVQYFFVSSCFLEEKNSNGKELQFASPFGQPFFYYSNLPGSQLLFIGWYRCI